MTQGNETPFERATMLASTLIGEASGMAPVVAPKKLWKSKTFWTGIAGLLAAGGGYATGEMTLGMTVQTAVTSLLGIFLRSGMLR